MNDLFLRTCRGESTPRRPVWIMRQAGRYLPQYRAVREKHSFLDVCKTPELATAVSLQPVDLLGVDAAILFADILLPLESLGVGIEFLEGRGPVVENPIRNAAAIRDLTPGDVRSELSYVADALRMLRRELEGRVPLIGFAASPWTLAAYLVEGGVSKSFGHLLGWSWDEPESLERLLDLLAGTTAHYLEMQVEAGAQAIQIFDTWGGLLDAARWRRLVRPTIERALQPVSGSVPLIYYVNGGAHLEREIGALAVDVLSVDWRRPLAAVRERFPDRPLQGNLDPTTLLARPERVRAATHALLESISGPHILNLGHGILPDTPVECARAFVEAAREVPVPAGSDD